LAGQSVALGLPPGAPAAGRVAVATALLLRRQGPSVPTVPSLPPTGASEATQILTLACGPACVVERVTVVVPGSGDAPRPVPFTVQVPEPRSLVAGVDADGVRPLLLGPDSRATLSVSVPAATGSLLSVEVAYTLQPPAAGLVFAWAGHATDRRWTACYAQTEVRVKVCARAICWTDQPCSVRWVRVGGGQGVVAGAWLPSWRGWELRCPWTITLTVPAGLTVLAPGRAAGPPVLDGRGMQTVTFHVRRALARAQHSHAPLTQAAGRGRGSGHFLAHRRKRHVLHVM
jgi:hypothetical protein